MDGLIRRISMSIEDYEFSDDAVYEVIDCAGDRVVALNSECYGVELKKSDVIALAKHFKLTPNDIEDK